VEDPMLNIQKLNVRNFALSIGNGSFDFLFDEKMGWNFKIFDL